MPLLENLRLDELAVGRQDVSLLIVAPIKVRGATASMVVPIAVVQGASGRRSRLEA